MVKRKMNDYDITDGEQIDNYLKKKFPSTVYRGIVVDDQIIPLKNGQFIINNKDMHWTAIYKTNNKLYEYDSYGRDMLPNIDEIDVPVTERQGIGKDMGDCGQRTIAKMIQIFG